MFEKVTLMVDPDHTARLVSEPPYVLSYPLSGQLVEVEVVLTKGADGRVELDKLADEIEDSLRARRAGLVREIVIKEGVCGVKLKKVKASRGKWRWAIPVAIFVVGYGLMKLAFP